MSKYYSLVEIDRQEEIAYQFNIDIDDNNNVVIDIALQEGQINACRFTQDLYFALHIVNGVLGNDEARQTVHNFKAYSVKPDVLNKKIVTTIFSKEYCRELLAAEISSAFNILYMSSSG